MNAFLSLDNLDGKNNLAKNNFRFNAIQYLHDRFMAEVIDKELMVLILPNHHVGSSRTVQNRKDLMRQLEYLALAVWMKLMICLRYCYYY